MINRKAGAMYILSLLRGLGDLTGLATKKENEQKSAKVNDRCRHLDTDSVFSTLLITPTATVCLMSRTANRPRGGYSW